MSSQVEGKIVVNDKRDHAAEGCLIRGISLIACHAESNADPLHQEMIKVYQCELIDDQVSHSVARFPTNFTSQKKL